VAVRQPGSIAIYFACFFGFAVFMSLFAHAVLAFESDVRWLALMGTLLTTIYIIALSLGGVGLLHSNVFIAETLTLSGYIMIFSLIACCGRSGPLWLILQVVTFLAFVIAFGAGSATFRSSGGEINALFGPAWAQAIYYVYYSLSGIYRFCALVECKNRCASNIIEEISYWVLILVNTGMFFAVFAVKPIFLQQTANSLDDATLLLDMSTLVQYSVTPLLLVHFEALSHAQARSLMLRVQQANNQLAVAQSAAQARREFIRYVFHEASNSLAVLVLHGYQKLLEP
jgi:signal transduction histidine kinase